MMFRVAMLLVVFGYSATGCADWYMDITYSGVDGGLKGDGKRMGFSNELQVDNTTAGWQLSAGYEVNQYAAFEVSYVDFGHQTTNVNAIDGDGFYYPACASVPSDSGCYFFNPFSSPVTPGAITGQPVVTPAPTLPTPPPSSGFFGRSLPNTFGNFPEYPAGYNAGSEVDTRLRGLRLALLGNLPITERIKGSFQGGVLIPDYTASITTVSSILTIVPEEPFIQFTQTINKETETSHQPALFIGLGFQVDITGNIAMKLSWEKFLDVGEADYIEQNLDTYNLAMRFHF